MRIPVLTVGPAASVTHRAAAWLHEANAGSPDSEGAAALPAGIEPDWEFPPLPLGEHAHAAQSILGQRSKSLQWKIAELENLQTRYLWRGFIEAGDGAVPESICGVQLFSDPCLQTTCAVKPACAQHPARGDVSMVHRALRRDLFAQHGLHGEGVLLAIVDRGIDGDWLDHHTRRSGVVNRGDSWSWRNAASAAGGYPFGHGTRSAFNALQMAPRATILDCPILSFDRCTLQWQNRLGAAFRAYQHLSAHFVASRSSGTASAMVVNNSWYVMSDDFPAGHCGRYVDNPRHPFNQKVIELAKLGADIVFAAGNCGCECADPVCPENTTLPIMGANALRHVLTVAACDLGRLRCGFSSRGPGIRSMARNKPDLAGYSHFLSANFLELGDVLCKADSGTSTACPIVSGCIAALRTKLSPQQVAPRELFGILRKSADRIGKRWNPEYGQGIVNPLAAARRLGLIRNFRRSGHGHRG